MTPTLKMTASASYTVSWPSRFLAVTAVAAPLLASTSTPVTNWPPLIFPPLPLICSISGSKILSLTEPCAHERLLDACSNMLLPRNVRKILSHLGYCQNIGSYNALTAYFTTS